jgi:hypothetical protein
LFLIIGVFAIIIILIPVTNTFSITQKPNGNTPFTDNANKSELNISKNSIIKTTRDAEILIIHDTYPGSIPSNYEFTIGL